MSEPLEKQKFKGPDQKGISNCVDFQDGDFIHPFSQSSINPIELSPININQPNKFFLQAKIRPSVISEEQNSQAKPEFLRLIFEKTIQNNFINNLWNKSYLRKLHQLTPYQRETLDDLRLEINKQEQWNWDVFTPYSKVIFFWNFSQILFYLFVFFWIPFKLSFNMVSINQLWEQNNNQHIYEIMVIMILSFDVLVGMNLAFMEKGQIICNRTKILKNYCKQYAFVDLVSLIVLTIQFFIHEANQKTLTFELIFSIIFYLLRLNKIEKILASIHEFFNLKGKLNDALELVQMVIIIMYIIHIFACLWHYIGQLEYTSNWIDFYGFSNSSVFSRYNVAIYWATMTMTTVGYGDVTPKNDLETLVNNITMLIGSIVFAYSVNSIGIFVSNIYKNRQEYNRSVTILNSYMSRNQVPFDLQTRIRSYLKYIWTEEKQMNEEEVGEIVSKLSSHLQDELNFQLKGNILQKCRIITKTFSQKFQRQLLFFMEEQSFSPEERIISINQVDDCALYIILKGEIEILCEGINQNGDIIKRNSLRKLTEGDYFGEMEFFTEKPRTASAIARGFVRVYKIKRENILKILNQYPNEKEKFCSLRDRLMMKESVPFAVQCYSCNGGSHLVNECHILHFCADKEAILKREFYPKLQNRRFIYRKRSSSKMHPWIATNILSRKAKQYVTLHVDENLDEDQIDEEENEDDLWEEQYANENGSSRIYTPDQVISQSLSGTQNIAEIEEENKNVSQQLRSLIIVHQAAKAFIQSDRLSPDNPTPELKQRKQTADHHGKKQTIYKESPSDDKSNQGTQPFMRMNSKKKTMTQRVSKDISLPSDGLGRVHFAFQDTFDKLMNFDHYFPLNNFDLVLNRYAKYQKSIGKKRIFPEFSAYSFFFQTVKKGFKLRKLGEEATKTNPAQKGLAQSRKSSKRSQAAQFFGQFLKNNIK